MSKKKKPVGLLLVIFGILDLILVFHFGFSVMQSAFSISRQLSSVGVLTASIELGRLLFMISLILSGIYLVRGKGQGCIISYIQFPFRFIFMYLSFGFLIYWNFLMRTERFYLETIVFCMGLEIVRLFLTILSHLRLRRTNIQQAHT